MADYLWDLQTLLHEIAYDINEDRTISPSELFPEPDVDFEGFKNLLRSKFFKYTNDWAHGKEVESMTSEEFYNSSLPIDCSSNESLERKQLSLEEALDLYKS